MEIQRSFDLPDLGRLAHKYRRLIAASITLCAAVFLAVAFVLPKRFKARAVVNISTGYFQNTMVRDFVPEINDNSEIRAQRESLIRGALNKEFVESLGRRHDVIKAPSGSRQAAIELEEMRRKLEILGITPTQFQIGFLHSNAQRALEVTQEALAQVLIHLRAERRRTLVAIRDSIRHQMETLALNTVGSPDPSSTAHPDVLRKELERIQAQLNALEVQYTKRHPRVVELRQRENLLKKWLDDAKIDLIARAAHERDWSAQGKEPVQATAEVYADLSRKVNYLNVALDADTGGALDPFSVIEEPALPLNALWPNKPMLLIWGILIGCLISITAIIFLEYVSNVPQQVSQLASSLGSLYLGELPSLGQTTAAPEEMKTTNRSVESKDRAPHESLDQ